MYICVYHDCLLYCHELAETVCLDIIACLNCLNCDWKWALVPTLYNTIAWKCYPCIWHLVYCIPRSLPLLLVCSHSWPLISQHTYPTGLLVAAMMRSGICTCCILSGDRSCTWQDLWMIALRLAHYLLWFGEQHQQKAAYIIMCRGSVWEISSASHVEQ